MSEDLSTFSYIFPLNATKDFVNISMQSFSKEYSWK